MLKTLANIFKRAINGYLNLDPEFHHHLKKLKNRYIKIELRGLDLVFYLFFSEQGRVEILDNTLATPDVSITGTPLSLLRLSLTRTDRKKFFSDDIKVEGDLDLAQQIIDLFDHLDIDWEEILAKKIGDASAYHIGKALHYFKNWCESTRESLRQDTVDYVHEEKCWFPQVELLKEFFDEVDAMRMDVERLEAKLKQLSVIVNK